MLAETKLGLAAAGTWIAGLSVYETPHFGGVFLQNEILLHDTGLVVLGAAALLSLATAGAKHHRDITTEGELEDSKGYLYKPSTKASRQERQRLMNNLRRTTLRRLGF